MRDQPRVIEKTVRSVCSVRDVRHASIRSFSLKVEFAGSTKELGSPLNSNLFVMDFNA